MVARNDQNGFTTKSFEQLYRSFNISDLNSRGVKQIACHDEEIGFPFVCCGDQAAERIKSFADKLTPQSLPVLTVRNADVVIGCMNNANWHLSDFCTKGNVFLNAEAAATASMKIPEGAGVSLEHDNEARNGRHGMKAPGITHLETPQYRRTAIDREAHEAVAVVMAVPNPAHIVEESWSFKTDGQVFKRLACLPFPDGGTGVLLWLLGNESSFLFGLSTFCCVPGSWELFGERNQNIHRGELAVLSLVAHVT